MKACAVAAAVACALAQGVSATARHHLKASGVSFGPKSCISLTRSAGGSCVISTDCEGLDTSATEFAFDCVGQVGDGGIVRHSFGVGGFEANEEFDTEVKCDRCEKPTAAVDAAAAAAASVPPPPAAPQRVPAARPRRAAAVEPKVSKPAPVYVPPPAAPQTAQPFLAHELPTKPPPRKAQPKVEVIPRDVPGSVIFKAKHRSKHQSGASQKFWPFTSAKAPEVPANPFAKGSELVRYGPDGCVSVYKSAEGHCIMKTQCTDVDISHYEFGLVCVDKVGSPVRHLFGKDSFDPEETFDTLIKCDQCLGLEDIPDAVALNGEVMTMSKDIANLKAVMTNISINVQMLNTEVFGGAPGPAPAPAPAPAKAPAKEKALVHHSSQHRRMGGSSRQQHRGGDVNFGARRHNLRHARSHQRQEQHREQQQRHQVVEVEDDDDRAQQQDDRSNDEQDQDDRSKDAGDAQANDDQQADDADRRDRQSDEDQQQAPVQASSDRDEDNEGYDTGSAPSNNNADQEVIRDDDDGEQ